MADVLLTHSYFLRLDPKQWKAQQPYPPLATLYAASVLRNEGHTVALFDPMFAHSPKEIQSYLEKHRPQLLVVYDDGFNYLTKMCLTNMREACFGMIALAKMAGCTVIVSSSDATDHSEKYLSAGADFILVGEGEITLKELVYALKTNVLTDAIAGLRFLMNGRLENTPPRANLRDLDVLPLPAWDLVDISPYRHAWMEKHGYFSLNMVTTRGCPFKCNWCAKPIYGNRYNSRSPENVVEEIKLLIQSHRVDHIWFSDDIFGLKPGWVQRFADLVEENELDFRFKIQSRADLLLEEDQIAALSRAGAEEVWIGAESGSQEILDAMDKGTKVEQIREATRIMKKHGIKPCYFLQFGYPGEDMDDIRATLYLVFSEMPHDIGISVSYPLPGTKFYETVKAELGTKSNWEDSDELLVMFQGTYPATFYKKLQRYVHYEFRKRQALQSMSKLHDPRHLKKAATLGYRIPLSIISRAGLRKYAF